MGISNGGIVSSVVLRKRYVCGWFVLGMTMSKVHSFCLVYPRFSGVALNKTPHSFATDKFFTHVSK